MSPIEEAAQLVLARYPISQFWEIDAVPNWLAWASHHKFLFLVWSPEGRLQGLAIARPLAHVDEQIKSDDRFEEDGDIVFIDLAIAETKPVRQAIAFGILARFGDDRKSLAFLRNGKLKTHNYHNSRRALLHARHSLHTPGRIDDHHSLAA